MKTKVIETHWVEEPVISTVSKTVGRNVYLEIEKDTIPFVKRVLYQRFLFFFWIPIRKQVIRKRLNEYILSCTVGDRLDYSHLWHHELQNVDETRRL